MNKLTCLCALLMLAACGPSDDTTEMGQKRALVIITTSQGDITLRLFADEAPVTVENFLNYVDSGHYRGTIFHRVISGFMIQGGGFTANLVQKSTNAPIRNESDNGLSNRRGTIAMARTSNPDSATSQFYINHADNPTLDATPNRAGYAVFGEVVDGMAVVDAIAAVRTSYGSHHQNVPLEPITIIDLRLDNGPPSEYLDRRKEACRRYWKNCGDNSDYVDVRLQFMFNPFSGVCKAEAEDIAIGEIDWGSWYEPNFALYLPGRSIHQDMSIIYVDTAAKHQNVFGAMLKKKTYCKIDVISERVLSVWTE